MPTVEGNANPKPALNRAQIISVLAVGLVARLAVVWFVVSRFSAQWFFHRGMEMGLLAQSVLQGRGLSSPFGGSTGPTAFIAPGYPLIVSAIFALFGTYSLSSAIVLMAIHVGLNLLTILLIMRLAMQFASPRIAVVAGLFWALFPPLIWLPTIFWDTSFSCCIVAASVPWVLRIERAPSATGFLITGAGIAIAGLINPALLPMLLAMLCWVAYRCRHANRYGLLLAAITLAAIFSPWPIRNARVFHTFIPLRSTVGFEMWMGNRPQSNGFLDESLFPTFNPSEFRSYVSMGEVAYVGEKSAEARRYIRSHPAHFVALSLRRMVRFWTGSGTRDASALFIVHACATTLLGLLGLRFLARRQPALAALYLLPLLIFPLPYYITHAEFRYRLVLDPLLTVLSAYALSSVVSRRVRSS